MTATRITIEPLERGYIVTEVHGTRVTRWAEPTREGALTIAARAMGFPGIVQFWEPPAPADPVAEAIEALEQLGADELPLRAGGTD